LGLTKAVPATDRAVQVTSGQIVTYEGRVIRAYFSADSGGHTESAQNAWGSDLPYCQARAEVYDSEAFPTRWTKEWTTFELERVARERAWIEPQEAITSVEVRDSERWTSGRASQVHFRLKSGKTASIAAPPVRLALGLRSTLFQVESKPDGTGIVFQGRGWGHGVGMAQYGAWALATTRGWKAEEILKFYYTGTEVTRLPASP
jgi:stage II sporulation protein D